MIERLKYMKESLMCAVESQLGCLDEVDTCELGEVVDMVKDLEEAIYYATITEAMNHPEETWNERMYYSEPKMRGRHMTEGNHCPIRGYRDERAETDYDDDYDLGDRHDERDGRSYNSRRMYMEAKEMKKDKASQLRELERYMQELSQDITEMISDASVEEKSYLEKKISALATKIGQMK